MSTFRQIEDSEIAVGSVLDQSLMQSLRDNQEAIFKGDESAPQISPTALGTKHVGKPDAGNNIIMQLTYVHGGEDGHVLGFGVRTAGDYRIRVESRLGDRANTDSDDGALSSNTLTVKTQKVSGGVTSDLDTFTHDVETDNDEGSNHYTEMTDDRTLAAGDVVKLHITTGGSFPSGSITMAVAIDDQYAVYGADVYGIHY